MNNSSELRSYTFRVRQGDAYRNEEFVATSVEQAYSRLERMKLEGHWVEEGLHAAMLHVDTQTGLSPSKTGLERQYIRRDLRLNFLAS